MLLLYRTIRTTKMPEFKPRNYQAIKLVSTTNKFSGPAVLVYTAAGVNVIRHLVSGRGVAHSGSYSIPLMWPI
jgi:hypothetical protein